MNPIAPARRKIVSTAAAMALLTALGAGAAACALRSSSMPPKSVPVAIAGRTFHLEVASRPSERQRGLSGRTRIDENGGMIFVFDQAEPRVFVMRDCPIPIDLLFLDRHARIIAMHAMTPQPPRSDTEHPSDEAGNAAYNARLPGYASRFPAQFAIEVRGGTIEALRVREGDRVEFDAAALRTLQRGHAE